MSVAPRERSRLTSQEHWPGPYGFGYRFGRTWLDPDQGVYALSKLDKLMYESPWGIRIVVILAALFLLVCAFLPGDRAGSSNGGDGLTAHGRRA